jgi:hypothetical protein
MAGWRDQSHPITNIPFKLFKGLCGAPGLPIGDEDSEGFYT